MFLINNDFDFVDVNEDTLFTLYPDRLWILDNDADEADIRAKYIAGCAGTCASPYDQVPNVSSSLLAGFC